MMISPEMFVELHKDKKYKDLLPVRDDWPHIGLYVVL